MRVAIIQFVVGFFFVLSTTSNNVHAQQSHTDSLSMYIEYGTGGGFTGAKHGYRISEKGALFSTQYVSTNTVKITYVKELNKSKVKSLFKYMHKIVASDLNFNEPGNTYSYLYLIENKIINQYVWGNSNKTTPNVLLKISSKLEKIIKS